jgi:hypothetical protein
MKICALDISFSCTGIAIFDSEKNTFTLDKLKGDGEKHQKFIDIQKTINTYTIPKLKEKLNDIDILVIEEPFPFGCFSSGLYALDTSICQAFYDKLDKTFTPRTLEYIHGCKSHKKSQSVSLAKDICSSLQKNNHEVIFNYKNNDACEAFLYLIHYMILENKLDSKDVSDIKNINSKIGTIKEAPLPKKRKRG